MISNFDNESIVKLIIRRAKQLHEDYEISKKINPFLAGITRWDWTSGVCIYSIFKYYEHTKDESELNYLIDWFESHIKNGLPPKNVNSMCPMLTLIHIYEITRMPEYLNICSEWAEWAITQMPRTEEMGLQHITGKENKQQLWADTLYMTVLFLAKYGAVTGKRKYITEAEMQFLVHIKYLTDQKTGLLYHGWSFIGRHHFGNALWGRGNAWFTVGVMEFLEIVGDAVSPSVKSSLIESLKTQLNALLLYQRDNYMWGTLINDPSSYDETSATEGFAAGALKAIRYGYVSKNDYFDMAIKAAQAVKKRVLDDGTVSEVSMGTPMGEDFEFYKRIGQCPTAYGQGLAVMLFLELLKWEMEKRGHHYDE